MQALQELKYIPVRSAVQNRQTKTHTVGVVFEQSLLHTVGFQTFQGMCDRCRERDYNLTIILRSGPDWLHPETAGQFLDRNCDGFIVVGNGGSSTAAMLAAHDLAVVECYNSKEPTDVSYILPDSAAAMRMAVDRLTAQGHRRIAHLGGPVWNTEATLRRESFRQAMRDHGLHECAEQIVQGDEWGLENSPLRPLAGTLPLIEAVLEYAPTAVVCANDPLALDLWAAVQAKGRRIPDDLSITGMDNIPEAGLRGLSSVDGHFMQVGRAAVDALLDQIRFGKRGVKTLLPVTFVERDSIAAPSR